MRISTKGKYAVTSMLDLALNAGKGPATIAELSENQGISMSYLEQLFAALRGKRLVRGVRGPGGGYYLARPSHDISIADIICAVDEWVDFQRRVGRAQWSDRRPRIAHAIWDQLSDEIFGFLSDISLADLVRKGGRSDKDHINSDDLAMPGKRRAA